jgi:diguanylate cyclase (GGDEF)-like protein
VRTVDGGDAFLFRMRHVDGSWRWVEATIRRTERRDRRGQTVRVGMMRDVTARVDREIDLRSANVRLAEAASTDPLTGLANRRRFADERTSAWRRSIEDHQPISLLLVDVDNFKAFNDRYGHAQGDACLQIIAEALESSVRTPFDVCARYGGEEFVVLLPATDRRDAVIVANRCRDAVRRRRVPHEGTAPGIVTVSVGVGTMEPMPGDDFGRLFDATDAAMYRSKRHGRDCIEIDDLVPRADRRAG